MTTPSTPIDKELEELFEYDESWRSPDSRYYDPNILKPKLIELFNSHLRSILDEEQVQRAYMEATVMSDFPNMMRVLTESLNKELYVKYLSVKETK